MLLNIRQATVSDSKKIFELEKKVWGKNGATLEMIRSRLKTFPDGAYIAIADKNVVGVVFFELIDSKIEFKDWYDYTDNGCIKKSHTKDGDTIFGIDLSVSEEYSGKGIGTELLLKVADYSIKKNIKKGILGGRIPFYYKYSDIPVKKYLNLKDASGKFIDPELRFYTKAGLKIKKAIPNYFEDPYSLDYGVLLEWNNPFYKVKSKVGKIISSLIFKFAFKLGLVFNK